jgi:hypothetical protein
LGGTVNESSGAAETTIDCAKVLKRGDYATALGLDFSSPKFVQLRAAVLRAVQRFDTSLPTFVDRGGHVASATLATRRTALRDHFLGRSDSNTNDYVNLLDAVTEGLSVAESYDIFGELQQEMEGLPYHVAAARLKMGYY